MANPRYSDVAPKREGKDPAKGSPDKACKPACADMTMKTANWPGLPGKSGPNRSNGVPKAKAYPKSDGI